MLELIVLVVIGTSIWVAVDAPTHGLSSIWALGCLLLWIVFFPMYLAERSKANRPLAPIPRDVDGWFPDPRNDSRERWREGSRWTDRTRPRP